MAGACLLNALVTCGVLQLLYKRVIKSYARYVATYLTYVAFAFLMTNSGGGLLSGEASIDWFRWFLYVFAGLCVTVVLFVIGYIHDQNVKKYGQAAMDAARKKKKK